MIRLVVSNQRGGVSKTTTTLTLARYFAEKGLKVLVVDTDPQGSIALTLGLRPQFYFHHFVVNGVLFTDCVVPAHPNIDVLCGNRDTQKAEVALLGMTAGELAFVKVFGQVEDHYQIVLIDCAPSISLVQTASLMYAKNVLIPVAMDMLSLQGASACLEACNLLSTAFKEEIRAVALLPTMLDKRYNLTAMTMQTLEQMASKYDIDLLPGIRIDGTVRKAERSRKFLADYDPTCKALQDYEAVGNRILEIFDVKTPTRSMDQEIRGQVTSALSA